MPSIFSRIISREIPAHIIAEHDDFIAFLDVNPLQEGHTLVVPKVEIDYLFDLPEAYLSRILVLAKPIAAAISRVITCKRVGISVVGLEVPHAHLHLIPINHIEDMNFSRPKRSCTSEDLVACALRIRKELK